MPATAEQRLAAARAQVDSVCQLLLLPTPATLDRCAQLLADAISELTAGGGSGDSSEACRAEAQRLRRSIGLTRRLLEGAAAFHHNWIRWLGILCSGYTNHGEPARVEHGSRLVTQG